MSGLEVAGIVLGAIPLIISALEHYADGIHTAKRYWKYKFEIQKLTQRIRVEQVLFINTLKLLLEGIIAITEMEEFLASPGGEVWREASVDTKLKQRLTDAYEIYLQTVSGMEMSLATMMEKLKLNSEGKPQFSDPSVFKQEYKRLKFALSKSEYSEQLNDLNHYNQALARLTAQSRELESARAKLKARSCPDFSALQKHTRSIFETLRSNFKCSCAGHAVKLRLESRNQTTKGEDELVEEIPFRVIFTYASAGSSAFSKWTEADIRGIFDQPKCVPLQSCTQDRTNHARQTRFNVSQVKKRSESVIDTVAKQDTIIAVGPPPEQIRDLCTAILQLQQVQRDRCAGYILDGSKRKYGIYPQATPSSLNNEQQWSAYTLRQVLTGQRNFGWRLSRHDKLKLAVDIASSVLQLYKTPWLSEDWNEDDIYFIHRPGAQLTSFFQYSFVYSKLALTRNSGSITRSPVRRVIRNQSLFTLGVLLIELLYGKSIEKLQKPHDLECQGTPGVVWCTVERLIEEEIVKEGGPLYLNAVTRCIRCDFNQMNTSLDDQGFRQAVFDGVVRPLEQSLQYFKGLYDQPHNI